MLHQTRAQPYATRRTAESSLKTGLAVTPGPVPDLVVIQAESDANSRVGLSRLGGVFHSDLVQEFSGRTMQKSWQIFSIFATFIAASRLEFFLQVGYRWWCNSHPCCLVRSFILLYQSSTVHLISADSVDTQLAFIQVPAIKPILQFIYIYCSSRHLRSPIYAKPWSPLFSSHLISM